jgi:hypothetical protein
MVKTFIYVYVCNQTISRFPHIKLTRDKYRDQSIKNQYFPSLTTNRIFDDLMDVRMFMNALNQIDCADISIKLPVYAKLSYMIDFGIISMITFNYDSDCYIEIEYKNTKKLC